MQHPYLILCEKRSMRSLPTAPLSTHLPLESFEDAALVRIPYVILVVQHPEIDFLLTLSFISFAVVLSGVIPTPAGSVPFNLFICCFLVH